MKPAIHPVILSGGTGSRLWPLSRANLPKQFLAPLGGPTLLQATARRVDGGGFAAPILICHEDHRFIASEQLRAVGITPAATLLEPVGRNTAPAAALAALLITAHDPAALMLVLPADHAIGDTQAFRKAVEMARAAAEAGALVTFGIAPGYAEPGYGYIRQGDPLENAPGCFGVGRFIEKPDKKTAEDLIATGGHFWNSGIFLFPAALFLEELERFEPGVVEHCRKALETAQKDLWFRRLSLEIFAPVPARSIDYAVMEKTTHAAVVPATFAWSDLGSWAGLWQTADKDADGNMKHGEAIALDTRNSCLYGDGILVAALGIDGLIVAARDDAVVVAPKDRAQDVRDLVALLEKTGDEKHLTHPLVFRPWGRYRTVLHADGFLVKRIEVNPGGKLSLQMHNHRAEHWIVVSGTARITRDNDTIDLKENESTFIPIGMKHSVENPAENPLVFIEVQTGEYLSEDDIVRYEDVYGRLDDKNRS
ncbi:MAG: mannose-1-phosphate guanylyltransferase/mannose-6-phosphate isomerase [Rhodospirillales bacterium]